MKKDYNELTENIGMLSVYKTRKLPCWRQWFILPLIMAAMLMNTNIYAQKVKDTLPPKTTAYGNIPIQFPEGGFEVDGDAFAKQTPLLVPAKQSISQ